MRLSLFQRLSLAATVSLMLLLVAIALVLDSSFRLSLHSIVRDKLKLHGHNILRRADVIDSTFQLPVYVSEPEFNRKSGSLIALVRQVEKANDSNNLETTPKESRHQSNYQNNSNTVVFANGQEEVWRSLSAADTEFELPIPAPGVWQFGRTHLSDGREFAVASLTVLWPNEEGERLPFVVSVLEDSAAYQEPRNRSLRLIIGILLSLGLLLLLIQLVIFRFGLRPLRHLSMELASLNLGKKRTIEGPYPKELQQLANNLNLLLENEHRQRQRYQDRMADLSHSLKTPLSILRGLSRDTTQEGQLLQREEMVPVLDKQLGRMTDIIEYQLQRAVTSGQQSSFVAVNIDQEVQGLVAALKKVYYEKNVHCEVNIDPELAILADENDVAEILGNLIDNAFKHCKHQVQVKAYRPGSGDQENIVVLIDDDGPGIAKEQHQSILRRGVRLDNTVEGQGFGLAIVVEILSSYDGKLSISQSNLGGARFCARIPGLKQEK